MQCFSVDVLVIGGGAAGMMAAYEASKHSVSVALVSKGRLERSGCTVLAPGAIAGAGSWRQPGDSPDIHFRDTVEGGAYLNEQSLVRLLVEHTPALILELEQIGALWQREADGETYSLRIDGGHSYPRCPFLEDRTGREMMRCLHGVLRKRHVQVWEDIMITRLLLADDRIAGAVGYDLAHGSMVLLRAKSVILACGGAGVVYQNTSNPTDVTGDGFALALAAGAALMDMEFVQFYPLGFLFPDSLRGALAGLLYYVHLRNKNGERFMLRYDPERAELSTRDRVARAICNEVREGRGGPRGGVYIDMTHHEPGYIARMQPSLTESYQKQGLDPEKDWLEVAPSCHFFMGGVKVDRNWASTVNGLFIAGETGAGVQGANRLSQNALSELLVSGHFAGLAAAQSASGNEQAAFDPAVVQQEESMVARLLARREGVAPGVLRQRLRTLMWEHAGVYRNEHGLLQAQEEIAGLRMQLEQQCLVQKDPAWNSELREALENYFLVDTAACIVKSALLRKESRGAHFREDYPQTDQKNWLQHVILQKKGDSLTAGFAPVDLCEIKPEGACELA